VESKHPAKDAPARARVLKKKKPPRERGLFKSPVKKLDRLVLD